MNLNDYKVAFTIFFVLALIGGNVGSMSSIRREWHAQSIYHKCVMPSVMAVCTIPEFFAVALAMLLYYIASRLLLFPGLLAVVLGGLMTLLVSFKWARNRGTRIYTENIRRAGFGM